MKSTLDNLMAQTSGVTMGALGFAVIIAGLGFTAMASLNRAERYSAQLRGPVCELRMTDVNGNTSVLARGNPGEICRDMVERLKLKMDGLPADYRAIWFELAPGE